MRATSLIALLACAACAGEDLTAEPGEDLAGGDTTVFDQGRNAFSLTARNLKGQGGGHIRLAIVPSLALDLVPRAIMRFRRDHPNVSFEVHTQHHDELVRSLQERGLIEVVGRSEALGRPLLYGTAAMFLELLGLRDLADLPKAEELTIALQPHRPEPDSGDAAAYVEAES
jgi:DNA-binding transcriptional LysR family regulator